MTQEHAYGESGPHGHRYDDTIHSYYNVARTRFVDNLCMQAVDHHLVAGPESPLRVFSPSWVAKLSAEQLDRIAGGDHSVRRKPVQFVADVETFERARKIIA